MRLPILVLSGGGHARVIIEALRGNGRQIIGVTDANAAPLGQTFAGVPVLGGDEVVLSYGANAIELANGLGNRPCRTDSGLSARARLFDRLKALGYQFATVASPHAFIAEQTALDEGCQVMAGAVIQPGCSIGSNSIVNTSASVDHDSRIGRHSHVAPGAVLCGSVCVGDYVHVGAGAIVLSGVSIANHAVVPAGSTVRRDVKAEAHGI